MKFTHFGELTSVAVAGLLFAMASSGANALTIDLIEVPDDPTTLLGPVLLSPGSGITIVGGSENFVGRVGDGVDPNTAQSATFSGFNLMPTPGGPPVLTLDDGIFLTNGVANIPFSNTDASFDHNSVGVGVAAPGTGGDADLTTILQNAGAPSSTVNDVNIFEFEFGIDDSANNAVQAQFVFGSDEFPDQGVTDVFAFIVDGTNFAFFPDGSLVSFVQGANAANFNDNTNNVYPIEYDGISNVLTVTGLLDPNLTTHTLKIAIGDTSDSVFDSGLFISGLTATVSTGTGGVGDPGSQSVPEPTALLLLGAGLAGISRMRRKAARG